MVWIVFYTMTNFENDDSNVFHEIVADIDSAGDPVNVTYVEVVDAQAEFIKRLGIYQLNPLPINRNNAHSAQYEVIGALAEFVPEVFNSTKVIDERLMTICGLSDALAMQRLEGFSTLLAGKYTLFDERTNKDKAELRKGLLNIMNGMYFDGEEPDCDLSDDEHSMMVEVGRALSQEIIDDVEEFSIRANIEPIDIE